jgi:hypothetical protein
MYCTLLHYYYRMIWKRTTEDAAKSLDSARVLRHRRRRTRALVGTLATIHTFGRVPSVLYGSRETASFLLPSFLPQPATALTRVCPFAYARFSSLSPLSSSRGYAIYLPDMILWRWVKLSGRSDKDHRRSHPVSGILKSLAYCQQGWKSLILPRSPGHAIRGPFRIPTGCLATEALGDNAPFRCSGN